MRPAPRPIQRTAFAHWRFSRGLTTRATAALVAAKAREMGRVVRCSHEKVRTLCLPLDHAERSVPDDNLGLVIEALTEGVVSAASFQPLRPLLQVSAA